MSRGVGVEKVESFDRKGGLRVLTVLRRGFRVDHLCVWSKRIFEDVRASILVRMREKLRSFGRRRGVQTSFLLNCRPFSLPSSPSSIVDILTHDRLNIAIRTRDFQKGYKKLERRGDLCPNWGTLYPLLARSIATGLSLSASSNTIRLRARPHPAYPFKRHSSG